MATLKKSKKYTDIYEIAKIAGVSPATVSNVFNNRKSKYSEATAEKILKIAKEYNYLPSTNARRLVLGRSYNIGLVFYPDFYQISNPFYSKIIESILSEINKKSYNVIFSRFNEENKHRLPDIIKERNADGLIILNGVHIESIEALIELSIPIVVVDYIFDEPRIDFVVPSGYESAKKSVEKLIDLGHKKIAFINSFIEEHPSNQQRYQAYQDALRENNIQAQKKYYIVAKAISGIDFDGPQMFDAGMKAMQKLLSSSDGPTAVMCANDEIAIGAMKAITLKGLQIPKDISVIGFDDILSSRHTIPALCTSKVDKQKIGKIVIKTLFERINNSKMPGRIIQIPTSYVDRESIGPVKHS